MALTLTVCAGCMVLSVCSKKEGAAGGAGGVQKVTLWHQSVGETDPSGPILKRLIAEWNTAHPEYQITEDGVSGEQYKTKINAALQANEAPEFAYLYGGSFMRPYLKAGKFLEISAYTSKDVLSRILPGSLSQVTYDGKLYTLPCYTHIASLRWGPIGAGLMVAAIPTIILYILLSNQVQKSMIAGAVKG